MVSAVSAMTSADTAAIIGSMDSVAYTYMRTGKVCVAGEVTKIDSVTSSKLLMNASSQPRPPRQDHRQGDLPEQREAPGP